MTSAPTATTLGYVLLCLVLQKPRSGYDLCQVLETTPMAHYSSSPGAIYPALQRLESKGLVQATTEKADSLRPRRVYRTTALGTDALRTWITRSVTRDDLVRRVDEVMLRFAFLGYVAGDDDAARFLHQLAQASDAYADELETYHAAMGDLEPPHGRLVLEPGIEYHRSLAAWARRVVGRFEGQGDRAPGNRRGDPALHGNDGHGIPDNPSPLPHTEDVNKA